MLVRFPKESVDGRIGDSPGGHVPLKVSRKHVRLHVFSMLLMAAYLYKKRHPLTQHQLVLHGRANRKRVAESIAKRITKSTSAMLLICQSIAEQ